MPVMTCSLEEYDWETVQRFTVVLAGPRDGGPYSRGDFLEPLTAVIGDVSKHCLSFGPCGRNSEWWLTLKDTDSRDRMLLAGFVKVRNRYTFRIRSAAKSQFVVRVHWAPPFMSNKFISAMLSKHVSIVSMDKERALSDGFDGLATGVRQIVVQGKMGDVPHTSAVVCPYTGVTHTILLTITGRKSLCLRCNGEGHVRRDCMTPYCRHHEVYGHSAESCAEAKREGRRDGWGFTFEEERRLGGAAPRELPTAGRGKSAVGAGRGTSPAPRTQVAASAGAIITDVIVAESLVGAADVAVAMSTSDVEPSVSESMLSDTTDGEASDADMPLWSAVVSGNKRKRDGGRVRMGVSPGVPVLATDSLGSSPGTPSVLATVPEEPSVEPLVFDEPELHDPAPKALRTCPSGSETDSVSEPEGDD